MASDRTQRPIAISGIRADNPNQPPARIELRDMRKNNPKQWNLFLLGMERFMDTKRTSEKAPLSYYQIAGIHGKPFTSWPGAGLKESAKTAEEGYCSHSSILFLPWHRPYLSLFEMTLHRHINDIANEYQSNEGKQEYLDAARTFRLPYWDWARPADGEVTLYPKEAWATEKHQVIRPGSGGKLQNLTPNPLAGYRFGSEGQSDEGIDQFRNVHATLRHPNTDSSSSLNESRSLDSEADKQMGDYWNTSGKGIKGKNLTERTLFILQSYTKYAPMSNNQWYEKDWKGWGGLEDIHGSVHFYVGGRGHMGYPETAAFDPIFWLHHCNIDRLFAIWQALHYNAQDPLTYVTKQVNLRGNFSTPQGAIETSASSLAPFLKSEKIGDYFTSEDVKDTKRFGYVYPETQDWLYKTREQIVQRIQETYTPTAAFANLMMQTGSTFSQATAELTERAKLHQMVAEAPLNTPLIKQTVHKKGGALPADITDPAAKIQPPPNRNLNDLISGNKYLEWLVNVKAEKHANNGDFLVHFFLGAPEDANPQQYLFNPTHVAVFSTFGQDSGTGCIKCQKDRANQLEVTGQIPLTVALVERFLAGQVSGLDVQSVEDYLKVNLHWRVTTKEGVPLVRDQISGLLVGVVTNEVTLPDDPNGLPTYAPDVVPRPAATINESGTGRGNGTGFVGGEIPVAA